MDLFGDAEYVSCWDIARHWLGRNMLTKVLKDYGKEAVKRATLKTLADEAIEQKPYMIALLKDGMTGFNGAKHPRQMDDFELAAFAQERNVSTLGKTRDQLIRQLT